jgi:hypothetical protein
VTATDERAAVDADPLDLARAWARRVGQIADYWAERKRTEAARGDSPGMARVEAAIAEAGRQQFEAAQMAAFLAEVSLAEDVRRIADTLTVVPAEGGGEHEGEGTDPDEDLGADTFREPGQ